MVRCHWQVEQGLSAYVGPGNLAAHKDSEVRHAYCAAEVTGPKDLLQAVFTLPGQYTSKLDQIKDTGVILASHAAPDWKGKILTELAVVLASQGYVVLRFCCKQGQHAHQRLFERALEVCATSPYAQGVRRWLFAGHGRGAQVAALCSAQCHRPVVGLVLLSYPLVQEESMDLSPVTTGATPESAEDVLMGIQQPVLLVMGDADELCRPDAMQACAARMTAAADVRLLVVQDSDHNFKTAQGRGPAIATVRQVAELIVEFVAAVENNTLQSSQLPRANQQQPHECTQPAAASTHSAPLGGQI
ncbi:hypothetical protein WJX72_002742 [[Myrmecia] bisecta]|uniref:KANL3/Tex30 alpha/beta hydrolase-like domain-containing protein n=1 Tax=[Myrmecia] bisecta TaxID=41462 RepID=A0AAW1Q6Q8_9CHLO